MKIIFCSFIAALILNSCNLDIERVVVKTYSNGQIELEHYYAYKNNDSVLVREVGYYPQGQKRIEGEYADGLREGQWMYWYDNGNIWSQAHYKAGIRHGRSTVWFENGQKYFEGRYRHGERVGRWRFWDDDGTLVKEVNYD